MKKDLGNNNFELIEKYITNVLSIVRSDLEVEASDTITHYLDHGEYEMSFECLFLEIMNLGITSPIDLAEGLRIGKLLKLNEESVFDVNFWMKFEKYILANEYTNGRNNV